MGLLDSGSKVGFSVLMGLTSILLALFLFSVGTVVIGAILGVVLPSGFASSIGILAMVGVLGTHYLKTWPIWGTTAEYRAYNEFNIKERTEPIDPDDVAEILSLVNGRTSGETLKGINTRATIKLAEAIYNGTRGDADAQRVIAQLGRIEGESTEEAARTAMDALTSLYEASERTPVERLLWTVRNGGWFLARKGFEGMNDRSMKWSEFKSSQDRIQTPVVSAIAEFAVYAPASDGVMREAMESDNEIIRGHAALAYGRRAIFRPEHSGEVTDSLLPLTNDTEKQVRLGATYGLEVPAMHNETARDRLNELQDGPDPDLREAADELMTQVQQELGSDGLNMDSAPDEHAADPGELASHTANLDGRLAEEPVTESEAGATR